MTVERAPHSPTAHAWGSCGCGRCPAAADTGAQTSETDGVISAIVPVWNESGWLPALLTRLHRESSIAEVVVADNESDDDTAAIAAAHNCRIVNGGRPAVGRNAGACVAQSDLLLFVDADVAVTSGVLAAIRVEFSNPHRTLVHFRLVPLTRRRVVRSCYWFVDLHASFCSWMQRHQGSAPLICVRRAAFVAVAGFDERVKAAEDVDFIRRVAKEVGGVAYVRQTPVYVSARRFELEFVPLYIAKCVVWALLRFLGLRASIRGYGWRRYSSSIAGRDPVAAATFSAEVPPLAGRVLDLTAGSAGVNRA